MRLFTAAWAFIKLEIRYSVRGFFVPLIGAVKGIRREYCLLERWHEQQRCKAGLR